MTKITVIGFLKRKCQDYKDSFFASIFIFFFIFIFTMLINLNLQAFNFSEFSVGDLDISDLLYSKSKKSNDSLYAIANSNIIVINTGNLKREQMANLLDTLYECRPRSIGIDVIFSKLLGTRADTMLKRSINKTQNIVFAFSIQGVHDKTSLLKSNPYFQLTAEGFSNFPALEDSFSVVRTFKPYYISGKDTVLSFAARLVKETDDNIFESLMKRGDKEQIINYKGNEHNFITLEGSELLLGKKNWKETLFDKIILLGYLHDSTSLKNLSLKDKYYTPMNERTIGRSYPDEEGVIIHANILSMLLSETYIKETPVWLNLVITFVLCMAIVQLFHKIERMHHLWQHILIKFLQILFTVTTLILYLLVYIYLSIKFEITFLLISILLSAELLSLMHALTELLKHKFALDAKPRTL